MKYAVRFALLVLFCTTGLVAFPAVSAQSATGSAEEFLPRFETAWRLVADRYWDLSLAAVDWDEAHDRYEPLVRAAQNEDEYFGLLEDLYAELGDNHSVFVRPSRVAEMRELYGDLPCLAVFGQASGLPADTAQAGNISFTLLQGEVPFGYVRIPDLASDHVARNTRDAVSQLQAAGARAFILDLRGNPGGRLVTMMQVAGIFDRGFMWRTITRWSLPLPYPALGIPETSLQLVILIDSAVNSAAEGLAGALQQQGRAVIIGETSAGNVDALLPFCLRDGSQAWVATGVLAPIGAPTWQGRGVIPDVATDSTAALDEAIMHLERDPAVTTTP